MSEGADRLEQRPAPTWADRMRARNGEGGGPDPSWMAFLAQEWTAAVGNEGSGGADCSVTGRAADLYYALWHRAAGDDLAVSGDAAVLDLFADSVHIRWS